MHCTVHKYILPFTGTKGQKGGAGELWCLYHLHGNLKCAYVIVRACSRGL